MDRYSPTDRTASEIGAVSDQLPTHISYDPVADVARIWLKGGAAPGEIVRTVSFGAVSFGSMTVGFDAAGHLLLIEFPGDVLHPDLSIFAAREYPAEGNL